MDTSTETTTNKRTRFSDATETESSQPKYEAPKKLLFSLIRGSLSSLPPNLTLILEKTSFAYIKLLLKLANKDKMLQKLNTDDAKIPSGARLKFELKGSSDARKHPDFIALADETETIVEQCRQMLKKQIVKALKIEIVVLKKQLNDSLCDSLRLICTAYCPDAGDDTEYADAVAIHLIQTSYTMLLQHTNIDADEFALQFKSLHSISDTSISLASSALPSNDTTMETDDDEAPEASTESRFFSNRQPARQTQSQLSQRSYATAVHSPRATQPTQPEPTTDTGLSTLTATISLTIKTLFFDPWDRYLLQILENENTLRLKKICEEHYKEKSNEESDSIIDKDTPLSENTIAEFIEKMVNKKLASTTTRLTNEINRLTKQLNKAKNSKRGQPAPRNQKENETPSPPRRKKKTKSTQRPTPTKKKKTKTIKKKKKRNNRAADSTDDNEYDSSDESNASSSTSRTVRSKKKKGRGSRGRRQ